MAKNRLFWVRFRVGLMMALLFAGLVVVGRGAWSLGVERREELSKIAQAQYTRRLQLSARRGMILDRYGEELAVEVEVDSVYADPREVVNPAKTARRLADIIDVKEEKLFSRLSSKRHFVWLQRRVSPEIARKVKASKLPGVHLVPESRRFYPGRQLAAQVLGFAGIDAKGLEGLERLYDKELQGNRDATIGLADATGNIVFSNTVFGASKVVGNNVELTIDRNLQFIVESELSSTMRLFQAKAGQVVMMNPHSGEVLAMASAPTFNLNNLSSSTAEQRRNRPVLDVYEPGSTMKVFTLAAALNAGRLSVDEEIFCERGRMEFYDVVLHDDHRDGWLNPTLCLKRSSNICFAKIAEKLGPTRLYRYLRRFGFGEKTGIQTPFEMRGQLHHHEEWSEFLTATVAFGQGVGVTGIQMATALSAVANGGKLMKPYLVRRITDSAGMVITENSPTVRRRVISPRTARQVADMMTAVTEEGGTGTEAAIDGYLVAGKTGTAQKSSGARGYRDKDRYVASFMGFVPADKPRLVISVVLDEPLVNYYGGNVAAPAFRRIAEKTLRYMGVAPNYVAAKRPHGKTGLQKRSTVSRPPVKVPGGAGLAPLASLSLKAGEVRTPDVIGQPMIQAMKQLANAGLRPLFFGSGVADEQVPPPGTPIPSGAYVQVNFGSVPTEKPVDPNSPATKQLPLSYDETQHKKAQP